MFSNIGSKLKTVAKAFCWIGIIASVIGGIAMIASGSSRYTNVMILPGIATMIGGALASWLGALGMYAFGELVENSQILANLAIKADMERKQETKAE